jgi:hypothetical protein
MDAYSELEGIRSRCIKHDRKYMFEEILGLLKEHGGPRGIGIRPVDRAELWQVTLSKPTSVNSGFAIGLRYVKKKWKCKLRTILLWNLGVRLSATTGALLNKNGPSTEERTGKRSTLQELLTNHHPHGQ